MSRNEKCPKCGHVTLVYDPVSQEAYCRRSICNFKKEIGDEVNYEKAFS